MAEPFTVLRGGAIPLLRNNIDTDTLSPGSPPPRKGGGSGFGERGSTTLADDLFANWRYDTEGEARPDFVFNQTRFQGARILISGSNFGCGSSRESAVWMLAAWGIRCVIAPSFAEIFSGNCFANGLLPMTLDNEAVESLADEADQKGAAGEFIVDLERCELTAPSGRVRPFAISAFRRRGLLAGLDEISLTLEGAEAIDRFVAKARMATPWLYPEAA